MKIKEYLTNSGIESMSILLSSMYPFLAYDIRNVILQLDSIDDTLLVLTVSNAQNISLDKAVYLRLKGRDEKV